MVNKIVLFFLCFLFFEKIIKGIVGSKDNKVRLKKTLRQFWLGALSMVFVFKMNLID